MISSSCVFRMKSGLPESRGGPLVPTLSIIISVLVHYVRPSSDLITISIPITFSDKKIYTTVCDLVSYLHNEQPITNALKHLRNSPPTILEYPLFCRQSLSTFVPYTTAWLLVSQVSAYLVP